MSDLQPKGLTRTEFDAVIRRAAELSGSEGSGDTALTEDELFRIAGEVGLSDAHIRRALAEVRSGSDDLSVINRVFGGASVHAYRVVPGSPQEVSAKLADFLVGTQLLQSVRKGPGILQYRPSVDWASQIVRAASFHSRKYYVASAKSVEIRLDEGAAGETRIEIVVDPGTRGDSVGGAVFGGGLAGAGVGSLSGWALSAVTPIGLAIGLGVVAGAGVMAGIAYLSGSAHKKKLEEVRTEVEGVLDTLELGESLQPPPSSWRRWVKRNFHGVAKDLLARDEELDT